jgi:L-fuconolactonase
MSLDRRRFLLRSTHTAMGAALAAALGPRPAAAQSDSVQLPIVDTHQHLWDVRRFRLPWLDKETALNRSFLMDDYLQAVAGMGVVQTVYMEVAMDPTLHDQEADYVVDLCRRQVGPIRAAVIGGRPGWEGFAKYVRRFEHSPYVKGVREIVRAAGASGGLPISDRFVEGVRLLGQLGLCFDLCIPPTTLADGAKLIRSCPDTRFVLDHCGNADPVAFAPAGRKPSRPAAHDADVWRRGLDRVAACKNTVCKISGIVARMERGRWSPDDLSPVVNYCLDRFGPDRVMFAGDWPVCTRGAALADWIKALRAIVAARPIAEQRKLFHDNAVAFYGLK